MPIVWQSHPISGDWYKMRSWAALLFVQLDVRYGLVFGTERMRECIALQRSWHPHLSAKRPMWTPLPSSAAPARWKGNVRWTAAPQWTIVVYFLALTWEWDSMSPILL